MQQQQQQVSQQVATLLQGFASERCAAFTAAMQQMQQRVAADGEAIGAGIRGLVSAANSAALELQVAVGSGVGAA